MTQNDTFPVTACRRMGVLLAATALLCCAEAEASTTVLRAYHQAFNGTPGQLSEELVWFNFPEDGPDLKAESSGSVGTFSAGAASEPGYLRGWARGYWGEFQTSLFPGAAFVAGIEEILTLTSNTHATVEVEFEIILTGALNRSGSGEAFVGIVADLSTGTPGPFRTATLDERGTCDGDGCPGAALLGVPLRTSRGVLPVGQPLFLNLELWGSANPRERAEGSALSDLANTATWGGMRFFDAEGNEITDIGLVSASGFNWLQAAPPTVIPAPGAAWLLSSACAALAGWQRCRRRAIAAGLQRAVG